MNDFGTYAAALLFCLSRGLPEAAIEYDYVMGSDTPRFIVRLPSLSV